VSLADRINARFGAGTATPEKDTLVIEPTRLVEVGQFLRDTPELAYDFLSNVTGVDYMGVTPRFEVVYHLYATGRSGGPLVLKARTTEDRPEVPSLVSVWPSANLQEREVWDLFGIRFTGHPNLKRILLWEGFLRSSLAQRLAGALLRRTRETVQQPLASRPLSVGRSTQPLQ
jgi:NADH:ubiquinone oxidoreductase subunit C